MKLFYKALIDATEHHKGINRKGGGSYITHPVALVAKLGYWGIEDDELYAIAMLHDCVEDCDRFNEKMGLTYIRNNYNDYIADCVWLLTNKNTQDKQEYLRLIADSSIEVLVIKLADRICNTQDFRITKPDYAKKYFRKADILFDKFEERELDVIHKFGAKTFSLISDSIYEILDWE